ncbi:MAG: hypothetical protein IJ004_04070 [Clostridia bacterium]|nr:hypothetical protein [Clostridia bacterium]
MTKQKRLGIIAFFIVITILLTIVGVFAANLSMEHQKYNEVLHYFENVPKNKNVVYSSYHTIYLQDKEIDWNGGWIVHLDKDYAFVFENNSLVKKDYYGNSIEQIISFDNTVAKYTYFDYAIAFFEENKSQAIYYFSLGELEEVKGLSPKEVKELIMEKSNCDYTVNKVRYENFQPYYYEITCLSTNETIALCEDDLSLILQATHANEINNISKLRYYKAFVIDGKIYFQFVAADNFLGGVVLTYEYDFDSNSFTYIDYVDVYDIEEYDTHFITQ